MPTYEHGDMWTAWPKTDHFLITTNAYLKRNGALVMGRGIARQARDRFPGIDLKIGGRIAETGSRYGLILGRKLGLFQVKHHFKEKADPDLISLSSRMLHEYAASHPGKRIDLNFPGIGNGGLVVRQVKPLIDTLPDNVHIWTYKPLRSQK